MKIAKYLIVFTLLFGACTDFGDINVDPDVSPTANPREVLTSAQAFSAWVLEGQLNDRAALWAQYWTWGPGVALGDNERYLSQPADFNNAWTRAYAKCTCGFKVFRKKFR
ncbi:MAG: hypothetical protein IPH96_12610 [Saprospiraceae bacterium]|nr:hypothetical protein [Saprospiraceae bacterium]